MTDFFAEIKIKEQQLDEQLTASSLVEVTGIVDANGVRASKSQGEELWSLIIDLPAWRIGSGLLHTDTLRLHHKVANEEIGKYKQQIKAESIVKFRAHVAEQNVFGTPQARLEEYLDADASDVELQEYLARLQQPITYDDAILGHFTFDRRVDRFSAKTTWQNIPINLNIYVNKSEDMTDLLTVAHALWKEADAWDGRIREYAVKLLLPLKNGAWLDDDEEEITPADFLEQMTLKSITVRGRNRSFEFWFDDGDLFWGHAIHISGNLVDGPNGADIPG